jgi:Flp pilus assembly protein TadD
MTDAITSLLTRALAALQNSVPAGALGDAGRAPTIDPRHVELRGVLERALHLQATQSLAGSVARALLDDDPDSVAALRALKTDMSGDGALREPERIARRGLALDKESAPLWLVVAAACASRGESDALSEALDRAVALAPADAGLLRDVVRLRIDHTDPAGALRDAEALVAVAPGDGEALALLAEARLADQRVEAAIGAATAATRVAPTSPEGHFALGLALMQRSPSGDLAPARDSLSRALQLSPSHHGALVAMDDLRRMLKRRAERERPSPGTELLPAAGCDHADVTCVNLYETIRKYECAACTGVMMCACDRDCGERFLAHQLRRGTRIDTQEEVAVTLGFVQGICASCRGLPEPAAPRRYGSPVARYYWREIWREKTLRAAAEPGATRDRLAALESEVEREFEALHARSPKYEIVVPIADEVFLREVGVVPQGVAVGAAASDDAAVSAVRSELRSRPAEVVSVGRAIQTLYAVLMGGLVRDAEDVEVRLGFFGRRPIPSGGPPPPAEGATPRDHGHPGYYRRRGAAIERHLAGLDLEWPDLLARFEASVAFSRPYTAYLWAEEWYDEARAMIPLLPRGEVPRLLRWLVKHYWDRRDGWPNFLVRDERGVRWVGVLAPGGKLTEENRRWIAERAEVTSLPYELVEAILGRP